ncbi:MAG: hypothetical protein M3285_09235 [Actinomycetota bacterium]|nr:hypothetical protein [Actinomycetota bacterium]
MVSPLPDGWGSGASDAEIHSDGSILIAAHNLEELFGSSSTALVQRYFSNGEIDPAFAGDGLIETDFRAAEEKVWVGAPLLELQQQHLVLAATVFGDSESSYVALMRRELEGGLDRDFGVGGVVEMNRAGYNTLGDLEVLPSGEILVAVGYFDPNTRDSETYITKLLANGEADTTFGSDGVVTLPGYVEAPQLAVGVDGLTAVAARGNPGNSWLITKLDSEGAVDESFGQEGRASVSFPRDEAHVNDLEVTSDGGIVVGGYAADSWEGGHDQEWALARFARTGELDPSFGTGGRAELSPRGFASERVEDLAVLSDGSLFIAGVSSYGMCCRSDNDFVAARLTKGGSFDGSFGVNGRSYTRFLNGVGFHRDTSVLESEPRAMTIDAQGRAIVVGVVDVAGGTASALARYHAQSTAPSNQPDVQLLLDEGELFGGDIYSEFGKGQSWLRGPTVIHEKITFELGIQDDGLIPGPLRVKGPSGGENFLVEYLADGVNVTDRVIEGAHIVDTDQSDLRMEITPLRNATPGRRRWFHVRAFSLNNGAAVDGIAVGIVPELELKDLKIRRLAGPWHGDDVMGGPRSQTLDVFLDRGRNKHFQVALDNEGSIGYWARFKPVEMPKHLDIRYRHDGRAVHQELAEGEFEAYAPVGKLALIDGVARMEETAPARVTETVKFQIESTSSAGQPMLETVRVRFHLRG